MFLLGTRPQGEDRDFNHAPVGLSDFFIVHGVIVYMYALCFWIVTVIYCGGPDVIIPWFLLETPLKCVTDKSGSPGLLLGRSNERSTTPPEGPAVKPTISG